MSEAIFDRRPATTKTNIVKRLENNGKKDPIYSATQKSIRFTIEKIWGDKFSVKGIENIPVVGSAIVAINHPSHVDEPFILSSIDRPMHFVGRQDKEFNPIYSKFSYPLFGVIGVAKDLKENAKAFVKKVGEVVKNKELICMFPEKLYVEDRQNKEEIGEFARGVVYLAKKYDLPIVPVFLYGTQHIRPSSEAKLIQKMHFKPVEITIGRPILPDEIQNPEQVRQIILGLKKQQ